MTIDHGAGSYAYVDRDGAMHECGNWDDIPEDHAYITIFVPRVPPEGPDGHTDEEHAYIDTFGEKLRELMGDG